jgi:phenylpropionate dioxygenase-like ring-hydroxylating dioxygenase large terminal subunit
VVAQSEATRGYLEALAATAATPFAAAASLPPGFYCAPDIGALEQEAIFARDWACPGMAADLPNPGDYLTFSIGEQPFFSIRGQDGVIRSHSNVCLHRMMQLVDGCGNKQRIVCPYHAWTYGTDGALVGAGHMRRTDGFDKKRLRLPELRTEIWQGWIYVTLNPEAPPVAQALASLLPVVEAYDMAGYVPVVRQDHLWDTNWKLLTENFMEGYHLPVAHRATVGAWCPVEETEFPAECHAGFTYQTFTKDENATYGRAHPGNVRLQGRWRHTSVMPTIFPAHMYVLAPDHLWYLSLRPKGVGQVQVRFGAAIAPEVLDGLGDGREKWLGDLVAFFDKVNAEDRFVVEGIYKGCRAPLARSGRWSWLERELHDFARYLAARLVPDATGLRRAAAE